MKRFTDLQHRFGFTPNEIRVIALLSLTLLAGTVITWLRSPDGTPGVIRPAFNYAQADSEFAARSRMSLDDAAPRTPVRSRPSRRPLSPGSIDINTASTDQLILLPGIGEAFAERIVQYREEHGPFARVDELIAIRGIGPHILSKLRPFVRAGRPH
jgi:competence protein ComEA